MIGITPVPERIILQQVLNIPEELSLKASATQKTETIPRDLDDMNISLK